MKQIPRESKLRPTVNVADVFRAASNGSSVQLNKGEDFDCAASTAAAAIRDEWERAFGNLTVRVEGDHIIISVDQGKAQRNGHLG